MIRPGIGYIAMTGGFNRTTYDEFRQEMKKLKSQGMRNLVIDLRYNGGGLVKPGLFRCKHVSKEGADHFHTEGQAPGCRKDLPGR